MGFFSNIFKKKSQKESVPKYSKSDIDSIIKTSQRLADILNESIKICYETTNIDTKRSRYRVAKEKLNEIKDISNRFSFIKPERLSGVEKELENIDHQIKRFDSTISSVDENLAPIDSNDNHRTNYADMVKQFKKEKKHDKAIKLLNSLIEATENESKESGLGVAPWYYEQLAIIYRKEKDIDKEIEILERYQNQIKSPGAKPQKLKERLDKAKTLYEKNV